MNAMDPVWEAEKKYYSDTISVVAGKELLVKDAEGKELGYTQSGNTIYIAKTHQCYRDLEPKEVRTMRFGVAVHEMLHQVFTNFDYAESRKKELLKENYFYNDFDVEMYDLILNLIEDPAIEGFAYQVIGGIGLKALHYTIRELYIKAPEISYKCKYPFEELVNAYIQFGDLGILKGEFTYDIAKKVFSETLPDFYKAILEPDNRKRIDIGKSIHEKCRCLWSSYTKKKQEEMQKNLNDALSDRNKSNTFKTGSKGSGMNAQPNNKDENKRNRNNTLKKYSSEQSSDDVDKNQSSNKDGKNEFDEKNQDQALNKGSNGTGVDVSNESNKLTDSEYNDLLSECRNKLMENQKKGNDRALYHREIDEFSNNMNEYFQKSNFKVHNCYAKDIAGLEKAYDAIVSEMKSRIDSVYRELKKIFVEDRRKKRYKDNGRVSIKRFSSGKVTTNLFTRKTISDQKMNMAVILLVDNSGSTNGTPIENERKTAIALCEILSRFDIPIYCIGFNVKKSVNQTHYVRWRNSRFERERILTMESNGCNFDSYSIRYATLLFQQRKEKHKLMIVISDGIPSFYFSEKEGIRQNALAVKMARQKHIDVLGIGVGVKGTEDFKKMYGKNFIKVNDPDDLFENLVENMNQIIRKW